jgi:hypothetical protein
MLFIMRRAPNALFYPSSMSNSTEDDSGLDLLSECSYRTRHIAKASSYNSVADIKIKNLLLPGRMLGF